MEDRRRTPAALVVALWVAVLVFAWWPVAGAQILPEDSTTTAPPTTQPTETSAPTTQPPQTTEPPSTTGPTTSAPSTTEPGGTTVPSTTEPDGGSSTTTPDGSTTTEADPGTTAPSSTAAPTTTRAPAPTTTQTTTTLPGTTASTQPPSAPTSATVTTLFVEESSRIIQDTPDLGWVGVLVGGAVAATLAIMATSFWRSRPRR